jgi:hypothetical protein
MKIPNIVLEHLKMHKVYSHGTNKRSMLIKLQASMQQKKFQKKRTSIAGTDGCPCSRVCARLTLRSAPNQHQRKFLWSTRNLFGPIWLCLTWGQTQFTVQEIYCCYCGKPKSMHSFLLGPGVRKNSKRIKKVEIQIKRQKLEKFFSTNCFT